MLDPGWSGWGIHGESYLNYEGLGMALLMMLLKMLISHLPFFFSLLQTEIAKRLNAIIAQIIPFLSQEVSGLSLPSFDAASGLGG